MANPDLTVRQVLFLQDYADGKGLKTIALEREVSEDLLRCQFRLLRKKLHAESTGNAIAIAIRRGLID